MPAQRIGDARYAGIDVLGIANDDHVGEKSLLVILEELLQVFRAHFFLAFHQHLDVDRQAALSLEVGGDGAELRGDGALVVMRVQEHGGRAGRPQPFAVYVRVRIAARDDLDVVQPGIAHEVRGQLGALRDLLLMFAVGADAGHGDQRPQVIDQRTIVVFQPFEGFVHDGAPKQMVARSQCIARSACRQRNRLAMTSNSAHVHALRILSTGY
jgi:hypothetical protein